MTEITFLVPDDSTDLVTELVEKLGGSVEKKNRATSRRSSTNPLPVIKKNTTEIRNKNSRKKTSKSNKKTKKEKIDHTYLFGKWKDFDIDAEKLREELWKRY